MAKSLRSKRKRFLRTIKRERYAVKELKRLKDMLGISDHPTDVEMKQSLSQIASVIGGTKIHAAEQNNDSHVKVELEESSDCQVLGKVVTLADASSNGDVVTVDSSQEDNVLGGFLTLQSSADNNQDIINSQEDNVLGGFLSLQSSADNNQDIINSPKDNVLGGILTLQSGGDNNQDIHSNVEQEMSSDCEILGEVVTLADAASVADIKVENSNEDGILGGFLTLPSSEEIIPVYNEKYKDQFGRFPPWFTRKNIERQKGINKRRKRKERLRERNIDIDLQRRWKETKRLKSSKSKKIELMNIKNELLQRERKVARKNNDISQV